jgi:hypothetical protein
LVGIAATETSKGLVLKLYMDDRVSSATQSLATGSLGELLA